MAETLEFDPASEATGSPLTVSSGSYGLLAHQYPTPPLSAQWAFSVDTEGARLGSERHENRVISLTIDCATTAAQAALQKKIAKLYREGGTLKRTLPNGWWGIFDVLTVDGYDPSFDHAFDMGDLSTVQITLICEPYGRRGEVTLTGHTETTLPAVIFTETGIAGDIPALGRLEITDNAAVARTLVLWGLRSRNYSSATTAKLYYESTDAIWTLSGGAASAAVAGSSGGTVVSQTALTTSFVTQMTASGLTHRGSYRVIARVGAPPNAGVVQMKLGWIYGTRAQYIDNDPVIVTDTFAGTLFYLLDLGQVSIPEPLPGRTTEWGMRIQATSSTAGDDLHIDYLLLIPVDEGAGEITRMNFDLGASPVIAASATGEVRYDGFQKQKASASTVWGSLPVEGDYLLIPPAGAEARTLQMIVKVSTGELADSDAGIAGQESSIAESTTVTLSYTPRFLVIPDA